MITKGLSLTAALLVAALAMPMPATAAASFPLCLNSGPDSVICVDITETSGPGPYAGYSVRVWSDTLSKDQTFFVACFNGVPPTPWSEENLIQCAITPVGTVSVSLGGTCQDAPPGNSGCFQIYRSNDGVTRVQVYSMNGQVCALFVQGTSHFGGCAV
jgi:hypothetical protein